MFGYWIKKRFVISILISIILSFAYMAVFVVPYAKASSSNDLKRSVYENCNISYDIPSPTKEQLQAIEDLDFVDNTFGYYVTDATLNVNGINVNSSLMLSDCVDSIEMTMFNKERIIASANTDYENPIYIGNDFAEQYGINVGDEITYSGYVLNVTAIVQPDTYKNCNLVILKDSSLREYIESKTSAYSGAYIQVNDSQAAEQYWRSYKPEGRLKDRSAFDSEEEYQIHFDAWESASYYNEITSFSERLESIRVVDTNSIWIGSAVFIGIYLIIDIMLFLRKTERIYFKTRKSKRGIKAYYVFTLVSDLLFTSVAAIGATYIYSLADASYISPSAIVWAEILAFATIGITITLSFIINLAFAASTIKSNKGHTNSSVASKT